MPRKPKPWWWKARRRWAVQLDGVRHVEPTGVLEDDLTGMAAWWESLRESLSRGTSSVGGLTIGELARRYIDWDQRRVEAKKRDPDAHQKVRSKLKRICRSSVARVEIRHWRADKFRPKHYETLIATWDAKYSAGYVRALASELITIFRWGTKESVGLLRENPIAGVVKPPEPMVDERLAERAEAGAWLHWLRKSGQSKDYILLQRILIHTGARPSEWTRATAGELDTRSWELVRREWKAAKTKKKPRRVLIPVRLRRTLKRHVDRLESDSLMFHAPKGGRWSQSRLSATTTFLRRKAIKDGVPLQDEGANRLTCYRWRHTAISELLMRGVDVMTAGELTGTSPMQITKVYGHLLKDHLAKAAEVLARKR